MKISIFALSAAALLAGTALAMADDVKIGALMDQTGPIASFMPPLQNAANLAIKHVNDGGGLLGGKAVLAVGDTTGAAQPAVDAATKLVNVENVPVIMGAFMSGTTIAAANAVTIPAGVVQISPTATSPAMTDIADNDTLFRLVPSDNYQGTVLAKIVLDEGIKKVAVTYVNNDYGVGIGQTFIDAYKTAGRRSDRRESSTRRRRTPTARNWPALAELATPKPSWSSPMPAISAPPSSSRRSRAACSPASSAPTACATTR